MSHPFVVGEKYRNRHGEYEVQSLDAPRMVIRYKDGRRRDTTIKLQARIWKNNEAEEELEKQDAPPASAPRSARRTDRPGDVIERDQHYAVTNPYAWAAGGKCKVMQHGGIGLLEYLVPVLLVSS